jgi:hypothetical protein
MSGKRVARHAQTGSVRRGFIGVAAAVAAVAVAVALVVAFGWLPGTTSGESDRDATSQQSRSEDAGATPDASGGAQSSSSAPSSDKAAPDRAGRKQLRACATSLRSAERAIEVAGIGVGHWQSHVRARTDMLEGRISMKRMDAIWVQTQAAGPRDQKRFKKALQARGEPRECSPRAPGMSPAARKLAADCAQRSRAANRAVSSAEAAMKDWEVHLSNMAKYANNKMSASMAQGRWVKAWRSAPKNIAAYTTARAALAKAPACPRTAS